MRPLRQRLSLATRSTLPALVLTSAGGVAARAAPAPPPPPARPNIVHIIADDLGWGDVGFNGQAHIKTPNLDALASQGLRMTNAYCPASVCAPTRAAMLTGFHNGHTFVDRNGGDIGTGFRAEDVMIGQVLRQADYRTAVFGKWGFGGNASGVETITTPNSLPNNHGYDEFLGYLNHTRAHDYFQPYVWQTNSSAPNGVETVATNNTYTHDLFQQRAVQYIAANAGAAQPFYLQFAPTIPHDQTADITALPGWDAEYTGSDYSAWTAGQKQYAAMITRMDAGIGQLMARLDDPNGDGSTADSVAASTLVIFTSDNGPTNQSRTNFFDSNGPWRGGKRDLTEGGLRTPWIMRWADQVAPGASSDRIIDQADLLPTLAELAGVAETPVGMDGVSFAQLLTGQGLLRERDFFVFESHESNGGPLAQGPQLWAVRRGEWKLIKWGDGTYRLYNLATDPTEQNNVVAANPAVHAELETLALSEGVEQPTDYAMTYRSWTGANNALVDADASWSGSGTPDNTWSAVVENTSGTSHVATVSASLEFLGFGVRGTSGSQRVIVNDNVTLTGRNEIRISSGGQIDLSGAGSELRSDRWIDVRTGGTIFGRGQLRPAGGTYNAGTIAANGGTLSLHNGGVHSGAFTAAAGATLEFASGVHHMTGAILGGLGTITIADATLRYPAGATLALPGSLKFDLNGNGAIDVDHIDLLGSSKMTLAPGGGKVLDVKTIDIDPLAALDLKDNLLVVCHGQLGTFDGATYTGLSAFVAGGNIRSTMPDAENGLTALAITTAGDAGFAGGTFRGVSVAADDVLVAYTYGGDANLDGVVSGDDYSAIDFNIAVPDASGWFNGDFNYDGIISGDDYSIIDFNIVAQGAPFPTGSPDTTPTTAVPEPASACAFASIPAAFAITTRRRRRAAAAPRLASASTPSPRA